MTQREKRSSPQNLAQAQIACYEKCGNDNVGAEYGLHGLGHACGSVLSDPENNPTAIIEHTLKSLDDIDKLDISMVEPRNDPWIRLNLEAGEILNERVGDEVGVGTPIPGPFTAASSLYPIDKLLRATRKQPEKVHVLLRFCTDALKVVAKQFIQSGMGITMADPVASGDIINRKTYREYVYPYAKEIMDYIHSLDCGVCYHICGDTTVITEDMVDTGCDTLSLDAKVELSYAKDKVGSRVPLMGNVDPINVMMLGTPEDVRANIMRNLHDCWDSPKGYNLATGCDIPGNSPLENLWAFMDFGRELAKWPLNPERFEQKDAR